MLKMPRITNGFIPMYYDQGYNASRNRALQDQQVDQSKSLGSLLAQGRRQDAVNEAFRMGRLDDANKLKEIDASEKYRADSMAMQKDRFQRSGELHDLNVQLQKHRLKELQNPKPDPMADLKRRKLELELKSMQNPQNSLDGFKDKKQKLGAEGSFRKEFTSVVQDFRDVRDAQGRVEASAKDPSAAGDLAMIFNYMKVLDPGSTVREGEFATAQNSSGVHQRMWALYNSVINGQRLSNVQREDFLGRSRMLYKRQEAQYIKTRNIFKGIAERSGLNVDNVLPDYGFAGQRQDASIKGQNIRTAINPKTGEKIYIDTITNQRVNP